MLDKMLVKSVNTPMPSNISYMWNFGSLLGLTLVLQVLTGLFLTMHYCSDVSLSFYSVDHIMRDVNSGWLIRILHANGASAFFFLVYLHIGRGVYYGSYKMVKVWFSGVVILFLLMAAAFIGYVLPWGQMSFWGATVITNLITTVPYLGKTITLWVWGGFSVDKATLSRFFSLHFLVPLILCVVVLGHIILLHESGSSNPLGLNSNLDKIPFYPYFYWKDVFGALIFFLVLLVVSLWLPYMFMDPDNFIPANPMSTPPHIQPEWYFLFAYAILRSIPNKLGGVVALLLSILVLLLLPLSNVIYSSMSMDPLKKGLFMSLMFVFLVLTWLGACPVESPYVVVSQVVSVFYFSIFLVFVGL